MSDSQLHETLDDETHDMGAEASHTMRRVEPHAAPGLHEKILSCAPSMLWVFDLEDQSLIYANARARAFMGTTRGAADSSRPIDQIVEASDAGTLGRAVRRLVLRRDDIASATFRAYRVDGAARWMSSRIAVFDFDAEGTVRQIIGASIDITESRRSEERADRVAHKASRMRVRERREIASILHDSIGQLLPIANARLSALRDGANAVARPQIVAIQEIIAEAHAIGGSLTARLSPPTIHEIGFSTALTTLTTEILRQHGLKIAVEIEGEFPWLPEAVEQTLYRVVRELLVNAAKHSGVPEARLRISTDETQLRILVEDSGIGFEAGTSDSKGLGLRFAQDQLDDLGVRMVIESRTGVGTRVELRVPLRIDAPVDPGGDS